VSRHRHRKPGERGRATRRRQGLELVDHCRDLCGGNRRSKCVEGARPLVSVTATIALTLALRIGANAAILGVINSLLLRPLPITDPYRLVTISSDAAIARGQAGVPWSRAMWEALQPHASEGMPKPVVWRIFKMS
jgi:hypothetical protein